MFQTLKVALLFCLLYSPQTSLASNSLYPLLSEASPQKTLQAVFNQIINENSLTKKHSLLSTLAASRDTFYQIENFDAKILPFYNSDLAKTPTTLEPRGTFMNYNFFISNFSKTQKITIKSQSVDFAYQSFSRSTIQSSKVTFGKALHIVFNKQKTNNIFLLVREIEKTQETTLIQTINLFKMSESKVCKIAEMDVSKGEENYKIIIEFIRLLGSFARCGAPLVRL